MNENDKIRDIKILSLLTGMTEKDSEELIESAKKAFTKENLK